MKYLSYIVIVFVMGIIAWNTESAIRVIFEEEIKTAQILESLAVEQIPLKTEPETVSSMLDELLGS